MAGHLHGQAPSGRRYVILGRPYKRTGKTWIGLAVTHSGGQAVPLSERHALAETIAVVEHHEKGLTYA